mmetsp:Transcript_33709/g.75738  ORF Transcript_33709/g.75738 Transcript_33709/m.75738 type:complete len:301 (-) Transcript_33709:2125-3027(-)
MKPVVAEEDRSLLGRHQHPQQSPSERVPGEENDASCHVDGNLGDRGADQVVAQDLVVCGEVDLSSLRVQGRETLGDALHLNAPPHHRLVGDGVVEQDCLFPADQGDEASVQSRVRCPHAPCHVHRCAVLEQGFEAQHLLSQRQLCYFYVGQSETDVLPLSWDSCCPQQQAGGARSCCLELRGEADHVAEDGRISYPERRGQVDSEEGGGGERIGERHRDLERDGVEGQERRDPRLRGEDGGDMEVVPSHVGVLLDKEHSGGEDSEAERARGPRPRTILDACQGEVEGCRGGRPVEEAGQD